MEHAWIRDLDAQPSPEPCSDATTLVAARRLLGEGAVRWTIAVAHALTQHIISNIPEHGGGPAPAETMRRAAETSLLVCLRSLVHDEAAPPGVPREGVEAVRDFVRHGIPLDRVLRGIRLGHGFLHQALRDAAPDGRMPDEMTEALFDQVDRLSSDLAAVYVAERDRWEVSEEAARWRTIEAIIAGDQADPVAAERVLDYSLGHHHVALILWREAWAESAPDMDALLDGLLEASGGDELLHMPGHTAAEWVWIGFRDRPDGTAWPTELPEGWRAGAGPPSFGPTGVRRSHLGARWAARIAGTMPTATGVCHYADVRTACLLTGDVEHARWYVDETLGPLAATDDWSGQLRETLRCYLASGRSVKTAAERLGVARNTVTYRVRRAEELLESRSVDSLELRLALEIMRSAGVLEAGPADRPAEETSGGPVRHMYVKAGLVR